MRGSANIRLIVFPNTSGLANWPLSARSSSSASGLLAQRKNERLEASANGR